MKRLQGAIWRSTSKLTQQEKSIWCLHVGAVPTAPFLVMLSGEGYAGYQFFQQKIDWEAARFSSFLSGAWFKFGVLKPSSSKTDGRSSSEMKGGNATSLFGKEGLKIGKGNRGNQIIFIKRISYLCYFCWLLLLVTETCRASGTDPAN